MQSPVGSGKTRVGAYLADATARNGGRFWFLVHRRELVNQTADVFRGLGIPCGRILAGAPRTDAPVQICSVQTLVRLLDRLPPPSVICTDECHHAPAASYGKILAAFPGARQVGLSATPERLDGRGLGDFYDELIEGPSVARLTADGYLAPVRAFSLPAPDLTGVRTARGDYQRDALADAVDNSTIVGDAVDHYQRLGTGGRFVAFCVSVDHSRKTCAAFLDAGIAAAHVDANTPDDERARAVADLASGRVRVLCNVELFGEGVDVPAVEGVILLRPTQSRTLYVQQVGRAMRPAPGKTGALVLDHAGNCLRHGLPDEPHSWELTKAARRKGEASVVRVRECPRCYHAHTPAPACPDCGYEYPVAAREIEAQSGTLVEIDPKARRAATAETRKARADHLAYEYWHPKRPNPPGMAALVQVAARKKRRNPVAWAAHVLAAREVR